MNIFRKNDFLLEIYQWVKTKPLRLHWRLLSTVCYINNYFFGHFENISVQIKILLNSLTANIMSFCSWFLMQDIRVRLEVSLQPAIKLRCFPECSRLQLVLFWKKEKWQWKATCQNFLYVVMWFLTGFAKHHSLQYMMLCSYKFLWITFQRMVCYGQHTYLYAQCLLNHIAQNTEGGSKLQRLGQELQNRAVQRWF